MGRRLLTPVQRIATFWSRVNVAAAGECWLWKGGLFNTGYGAFRYNGNTRQAHRFAAEIQFGTIPRGMAVCHKCDVRACVNPEHLFLGTNSDNMADAARKGRMARGERVYRSRLTAEDVVAIRKSTLTHAAIAKHYGVHGTTICHVMNRKTWRHIP
jgi:hypothetical protein